LNHEKSYRHPDRRPVCFRCFRSSSCRFGFRLGFGRRLDPCRFGASGQESDPQERTQSQRIGFGIGFDPGAGSFGSSRQQVISASA
jgi:hypothetical protein